MTHDQYTQDLGSWQTRFLSSVDFIFYIANHDHGNMLKVSNRLSECCFDCRILDLIWQLKAIESKGKVQK